MAFQDSKQDKEKVEDNLSRHPTTNKKSGAKPLEVNAVFYDRDGSKHDAIVFKEYEVTANFADLSSLNPVDDIRSRWVADLYVRYEGKDEENIDWRTAKGVGSMDMHSKFAYHSFSKKKPHFEFIEKKAESKKEK